MSSAVAILDQIQVIIEAALPGVTVIRDAEAMSAIPADQLPAFQLLYINRDPEQLTYGQVRHVTDIHGRYYRNNTDRDAVTTDLDSVVSGLRADPTLGSIVYQLQVDGAVPLSHPDASIIIGEMDVLTESVT